ncbi:MAG: phospholipase D-like domain-containing protein [Chloroflexi bacterium]|nr:phospholipase D-like domain-containing protein [Chloroflexota bacterium]
MQSNESPGKRRRALRALRTLIAGLLPLLVMGAFILQAAYEAASSPQDTQSRIAPPTPPAAYSEVQFNFGRGYIGDGWQLYFNEPDAGAASESYHGGIEAALAAAIAEARDTLDVAAFELNSEAIYQAILEAHQRGVAVRIVADDDHGLHDDKNTALRDLQAAGVPIVDDGRSGLMHNKFMILDGSTVWTGSWNYTVNGAYRNNNNALVMHDRRAASAYQREFDEMFERGEFGMRSSDDGIVSFRQGESKVSIIFAAEGDEIAALKTEIEGATRSIHIMTFVFSLEELAEAILLGAAQKDLVVQGVFEKRNSTASWSQLPALHCAGAAMRQDGNRYVLHHKVIIIDEDTVITGSFNFSKSAAQSNDENIVIIRDATIAGLYLDEWKRIWDSAVELAPDAVDCD